MCFPGGLPSILKGIVTAASAVSQVPVHRQGGIARVKSNDKVLGPGQWTGGRKGLLVLEGMPQSGRWRADRIASSARFNPDVDSCAVDAGGLKQRVEHFCGPFGAV